MRPSSKPESYPMCEAILREAKPSTPLTASASPFDPRNLPNALIEGLWAQIETFLDFLDEHPSASAQDRAASQLRRFLWELRRFAVHNSSRYVQMPAGALEAEADGTLVLSRDVLAREARRRNCRWFVDYPCRSPEPYRPTTYHYRQARAQFLATIHGGVLCRLEFPAPPDDKGGVGVIPNWHVYWCPPL